MSRCWKVALIACVAIGIGGQASAYSCGSPSSPGHCYGVASWQEQPQYFGAYSDIRIGNLTATIGGFVDNEIWLIDGATPACASNGFQACWVETGYWAVQGPNPVYFWADARPTNLFTLNVHILGGTDAVGTTDHFMMIKDGRGGPGTFQIWIYNDSLSTLYNGTSTGNPMTAKRIDIGQELAGDHGSFADPVFFTRNIWAVQALGPEYVFWYNRQISNGGVTGANPPFASWTISPTSPPPPEGGQFQTKCCG